IHAIRPSKPRLARLMIFGEVMKRASEIVARGRISSIWCSRRMLASIDNANPTAAKIVVRLREVMGLNSTMEFRQSFKVPAFENQDGSEECHCGIEQCVETVLQNELRTHMLFVRHGADYIERGKIRHQIGCPRGKPPGEAMRHESKSP